MVTTTDGAGATAAMQSLDPRIASALEAVKGACQACEDADREQAKRGAQQASDKYDGWCSSDAKDKFLVQGQRIIDDMWAAFNDLQNGYQSQLRPHEYVGPRLHKVFTDTWQVVGQQVAPVTTDVQQRAQQEHWTGAGASDYMKQLPIQLAALDEFSQYVVVAGAGVETPAQLQQAVFTAFLTMASSTAEQIKGYADTPTGDHYFQRCAWAGNTLHECVSWFREKLMTGTGTWRAVLDDHVAKMTSDSVVHASVLTSDAWPKATTGSTPQPSGDAKYTTPVGLPGVGSSNPVTDRGDSQGVGVDDAAPDAPTPSPQPGPTPTPSPTS